MLVCKGEKGYQTEDSGSLLRRKSVTLSYFVDGKVIKKKVVTEYYRGTIQ